MTTEGLRRCTAALAMATAAAVTVSCVPPATRILPAPRRRRFHAESTTTTTTTTTTSAPQVAVRAPRRRHVPGGKPAPTYDNDASRAIISGDGKFVVYHHKTENLAISNRPPSSCPRPAATSHRSIGRT